MVSSELIMPAHLKTPLCHLVIRYITLIYVIRRAVAEMKTAKSLVKDLKYDDS